MKRGKKDKFNIWSLWSAIVATVIGVLLTHYFTLKEIDYEKSIEIVTYNESENELLIDAQKYYLTQEYSEVIHIYNMKKFATNPVALSNMAYMYENGISYGKNIEKARELYCKAAKLDDKRCVDNYILFTIKYPISYENLLEVLQEGIKQNSEVPIQFIKSYFNDENVTEQDVMNFWKLDFEQQKEILKLQTDYKLKDESEEISDELIAEIVYYEKEEPMKYKELKYELNYGTDIGIYKKIVPVYIDVPIGEARIYYENFIYSNENYPQFIMIQ